MTSTDASSESSTIAEASLGVTDYGDGDSIVGKAVSQFEVSPFIDQ